MASSRKIHFKQRFCKLYFTDIHVVHVIKRYSWTVVFNAAMVYILDIRAFEAALTFQGLPKQLANKSADTQFNIQLLLKRERKYSCQSAREFTFCLLGTVIIVIMKPFKFYGMAKLQKINLTFYIGSTIFCSNHIRWLQRRPF